MGASTADETAAEDSAATDFWLTPSSYFLPTHYPISAWFAHAPFAAWLVDAMRPATIVELGTHYGFSCFAFADAAKRLGAGTVINALDSWEGDDHAGFYDEAVYKYVASVVQADFSDSVYLVRGWFSESRPRFEGASVDILHIDGRHAYEDVLEDYNEWRGVVRDGGVVLFHDVTERGGDFGVWRLWEEIAEPGRSFLFEHGHGLGVLAVGDLKSHPLRSFFEADPDTADRIRNDFVRLGDRVARQAWLESLPAELDRVNTLAHGRALRVNELEAADAGHREYIKSLRASTSWRVTAPLRAIGRMVPHRD